MVKHNFKSNENRLGHVIHNIAQQFDAIIHDESVFDDELFYTLAESFIFDQYQIWQQFQNLSALKFSTNKKNFNSLYDAKNFIEQNFTDKIDVPSIAASFDMTEYHFIRKFSELFQLTPHQYIIQKRLELSKQLLFENVALADIAFTCGFADQASFTKSFKKKFNTSPLAFKEINNSF
jgi:transcriptional regulator GlxA family with amidase domain